MKVTLLTTLFATVAADVVWPIYNQQCRDDAGPPYDDDEPGTYYHSKNSQAIPVMLNGECPGPLKAACASRPNKRTAFLEGPISCGDKGWYCRIMEEPNWPPIGLTGDVNFGHCNTTDGLEDHGYDQDGHCHGSDFDDTYYWWVRDHWHRQYNGRLRCCCGWKEGGSQPLYSRRIANRCDFRRKVVDENDRENCRDANEDHNQGFDDIGCDISKYSDQLNKPIPEDDSVCWEVQKFGFSEGSDPPPPTDPPVGGPTSPAPVASPVAEPPSDDDSDCIEEESDEFFFRRKLVNEQRVVIRKTCEWLSGEPEGRIERICGRIQGADQWRPAQKVCQVTCGTCEDDEEDGEDDEGEDDEGEEEDDEGEDGDEEDSEDGDDEEDEEGEE
mmetsp:Transcript_3274/g.4936  ORF Transcript_3274/g.4936 Transcript_3274/m.4936 type:complete len:385 (-) Transcript_3274:210-1364(-)